MKLLSPFFLILFLLHTISIAAQQLSKDTAAVEEGSFIAPKSQWFIALGGGIALQTAFPNYSVSSANLTNSSAGGASPFIFGKLGYRHQNKHQGAFMVEKTIANNGFTYLGEEQEGLGLSRGIDYLLFNLEYSYNLLNAQRFWLGPTVQLGIGVGDTTGSAFYDRGRERYFNTPNGVSYHRYDIIRAEVPALVFNYGIGFTFGAEVIDDRLYIGTDLRWLHSFAAIHEYEINYQNNLNTLNFNVKSPMMNIHWGLHLAYLL
jgi:hypothetical protein